MCLQGKISFKFEFLYFFKFIFSPLLGSTIYIEFILLKSGLGIRSFQKNVPFFPFFSVLFRSLKKNVPFFSVLFRSL